MQTNTVIAMRCIAAGNLTTAGNLSIEICYRKLKVNFSYCFRRGIFQNQVYNLFCIISWIVSYSTFIVRFVYFSFQNYLSFDFCFKDFRKAIGCLCVTHTAQISTDIVVYVEKDIEKRKVHNPVKECTFYQYHQRFTVLHSPKIWMKCCLFYKYGLQEKYIAPYSTWNKAVMAGWKWHFLAKKLYTI